MGLKRGVWQYDDFFCAVDLAVLKLKAVIGPKKVRNMSKITVRKLSATNNCPSETVSALLGVKLNYQS